MKIKTINFNRSVTVAIMTLATLLLLIGWKNDGQTIYFNTASILFCLVTLNLLVNYRSNNFLLRTHHSLVLDSFSHKRELEELNSILAQDNNPLKEEIENKIKDLEIKIELIEKEIKLLSNILNESK